MAGFLSRIRDMFTVSRPRTRRNLLGIDDRTYVQKKHACPACTVHVDEEELVQNLWVCPHCNHHFRINAKERVRLLLDNGEIDEFGTDLKTGNPLDFPAYEEKIEAARRKSELDEAVMCGTGKVAGRQAVFAIMSFQFMGGSMGSVVGERITRAILAGVGERLPVVIFSASGGARMQEGIHSLMQMAKTSHAAALLEQARMPLFLVLTDPTTGGTTASFAMLGDVILAEPNALIGFAGPRVIEGTIRQKLPEGFQRSEFVLEKGFIDAVVHRRDLRDTLGMLIDSHIGRVSV